MGGAHGVHNLVVTNHPICRNMMEKASKASMGSYSTMSLPRRMPVKKLVSAFNARIERQGSTPPTTTAAVTAAPPTYSTLQRRIRTKVGYCRINANLKDHLSIVHFSPMTTIRLVFVCCKNIKNHSDFLRR